MPKIRGLKVTLHDCGQFAELTLQDIALPHTWTLRRKLAVNDLPLAEASVAEDFFADVRNSHSGVSFDDIFLSVTQDDAGRHSYLTLGQVERYLKSGSRDPLELIAEEHVKSAEAERPVLQWFAAETTLVIPTMVKSDGIQWVGDEYTPKVSSWAQNYSVIPELSLGATQRFILCNENTLVRELPEERIFEHLKLIVNCHEQTLKRGKYKVGSCSTGQPPKVICEAVHDWRMDMITMAKIDKIQESIWAALQKGSIAVHCLAGVHRAACVTACHYVWRHYVLGHKSLPVDSDEIFDKLIESRPIVEPAYLYLLQGYSSYLKKLFGPKKKQREVIRTAQTIGAQKRMAESMEGFCSWCARLCGGCRHEDEEPRKGDPFLDKS